MTKKLAITVVLVAIGMTSFAHKKDVDYLQARRNGADAKIVVSLVNDAGDPVSNAAVRVLMGMNFRPKGYWIEGVTDEHGAFLLHGKTCGDEIEIHVSRDGFYNSKRKICFAEIGAEHEVKDGKWLPYGAEEVIRLRSIQNPIPLRKLGFGMGKDVPCTNKWVGVDMALGDFVKPYGKGDVSDFEVMVEWDGRPPADSNYCAANIRFMGQLSGGYYATKVMESEYPYVYQADDGNAYNTREFKVVGRDMIRQDKQVSFGKDAILVTRTRCVLDENGSLKSANYGFIRFLSVDAGWDGKPTMQLACIFNPTPNDTNLEAK